MHLTEPQQFRATQIRSSMTNPERHDFDAALSRITKFGLRPAEFGKVLARNCNGHMERSSEGLLWLAVIVSAYDECYQAWYRKVQNGAPFVTERMECVQFWFDGRSELMAGMVGLDHEWLIDTMESCAPWMWSGK